MKLDQLKPAGGSVHKGKRIGRGQGSGRGGTSTKGHKGQQSRSGFKRLNGFEGGQMPLQRRLPKFGFKNRNRVEYKPINISTLQSLCEEKSLAVVEPGVLINAGLIGRNHLVKILGKGTLTLKLDVKAHAFSATAKKAIESNGGTAVII